MALNTITPSNREEEYLSAIAGDEGATAPVPSNRREEWLRRIAEGQGDQTDRLDHIEDQIPVDPTSADVGKVMTVIADESGEEPVYKWSAEAAGGGAGPVVLYQTSQTQSFTDLETPPSGYHWETDTSDPDLVIEPVSYVEDGTPLTAAELYQLMLSNERIVIVEGDMPGLVTRLYPCGAAAINYYPNENKNVKSAPNNNRNVKSAPTPPLTAVSVYYYALADDTVYGVVANLVADS